MQRLSISELSSYRWSFFNDILRYSKLGIESVGLWRRKVDEFGYESAADLLNEMQMRVSSLSWAGGFTGCDGSSHTLAVDDALDAVYQAHMIGAENLIIHPGSRNRHTESHALRLVKSGIESILPQAQDLGVKLVFEPILRNDSSFSFIHQPEKYLDLVCQFDRDQVGLVLDLFHVGRNQTLLNQFEHYADRISLVQLADARFIDGEFVRCDLGKGIVPLQHWIEMLDRHGYNGEFEIELFGSEYENRNYLESIEQNREFFSNSLSQILTLASS